MRFSLEDTRDTPQGDGKSTKLNFDDWFYAIDDRACIVRGSAGRERDSVRDGACYLSEAHVESGFKPLWTLCN